MSIERIAPTDKSITIKFSGDDYRNLITIALSPESVSEAVHNDPGNRDTVRRFLTNLAIVLEEK